MLNPTQGPARERLERLDAGEVERLHRAGVLITDDRRHRPLYFDGRFLTARDLTREQSYFLTRLADLGRSQGFGVVAGLNVGIATGSSIRITSGQGITPAGELVMLTDTLDLDVADLARSQRLDAAFGLIRVPRPPARNLSGLFVVALRPVEFTANPISSYPTTLNGPRSVEDGDIVEATVVTLIPYPAQVTNNDSGLQRAQVAREIFLDGVTKGIPVDALPLAMIALERGIVQWVDPFLVRREVGAEHEDVLGMGFAPRALREAHAVQYREHLQEVLAQRDSNNRGRRFAAAQHFLLLPPAGQIPAAAIDPADFSQIFFPPEIQVDLSVFPADELPALLEESLLLPPIDLTLNGDEQESTSVLVLLPVPRPQLRTLMARLTSQTRPLLAAAPGLVAKRKPLEALRGIKLPRVALPPIQPENLADAAWREILTNTEFLWYIRRRNLSYRADIVGVSAPLISNERPAEAALVSRLRTEGLTRRFGSLRNRATSAADAEMVSLLSSPNFELSRTLTEGTLVELESVRALDRTTALPILERFSSPGTGEGIARLEAIQPDLRNTAVARTLAQTKMVPELDTLARNLTEEQLRQFAEALLTEARSNDPQRVAEFISTSMKERRL